MVKPNIKILDCTLRDGGYVNDFDFGKENISKIIKGLHTANTDLIEIGFLKDGKHSPEQTLFNTVSEAEEYIRDEYIDQEFCLMIRPDWYDISQLEKCSGRIKSIRFALRPEFLDLTLKQAQIARDYGYKVFLNPVNVLSYSNNELKNILKPLNNFQPEGIYIVDTFGSMLPSDLKDIFKTFNESLDKKIAIGLHLHENLSISLALASNFIEMLNGRSAYIDSSVLGMGRIPGNLCTELIMNYLNLTQKTNYNLNSVYELIDNPISKIKDNIPWGYLPAYSITAFNLTHRSYAEYLMKKPNLPLSDIDVILSKIKLKKDRDIFNESLIELLYNKFIQNS